MPLAELDPRLEPGWGPEKKRLLARLRAAQPHDFGMLKEIWEFLRVSEQMMLDVLNGHPANPAHAGKGCAEFGHFLYYLHHPHPQLKTHMERDAVALAAWSLAAHASKPASMIAPGYLENLQQTVADWPVVDSEGAIYGFGQYEVLDPNWNLALINLVITLFHKRHAFGNTPCVKTLMPGLDGKVRIGIVGDWGAGAYGTNGGAAVEVMRQLDGMNCDYLLHLGDTYYAGTGGEPYLPANEQQNNFIRHWPQHTGRGRSFALNSNHEMYSGGNGYFPHALGSEIFSHQNMTSYFALTFGKWVILGLDTAYHASATKLYMDGTLGEQQIAWLREYRRNVGFEGKKVLVLTHHEGMSLTGDTPTELFKQVTDAIGRAPDVWYWGHAHNGIAYSNASAVGRLGTRARCVGHSAVPYGLASALMDPAGKYPVASVDYFTQTPSPSGGKRMLNGFASLELGENGDITELFFEQGKAAPVWRSVNGVRFS